MGIGRRRSPISSPAIRAFMSPYRPAGPTQFNLAAFLFAATFAPPIFGLYAGAFGRELQLLAVVIGLAGAGLVLYMAMAVLALLAVYCIPLAMWRFFTLFRFRPGRVAAPQRVGC